MVNSDSNTGKICFDIKCNKNKYNNNDNSINNDNNIDCNDINI